jgi:hypothetical protein
MMIGMVLLIILGTLLIDGLPTWPYSNGGLLSRRWAFSPEGPDNSPAYQQDMTYRLR